MAAAVPVTRPRERCEPCGFDSDLYPRTDTITSQRIVPAVLAAAVEGLDHTTVRIRPDERTWSIVEYVHHVALVAAGNLAAIDAALSEPGQDLGQPPDPGGPLGPADPTLDLAAALDRVEEGYEALRSRLVDLDDEGWEADVVLGGERRTVGWFARHVLHDGLHHLADIGRIRHALGHGAASVTGTVTGLHRSSGGVPKEPADTVFISPTGVEGDVQADRRHHGRPVQAVCLWSQEVIEGLQAEGHPIGPGSAGENVTVSGVDWAGLAPGARIDVGPVPLLISAPRHPLRQERPVVPRRRRRAHPPRAQSGRQPALRHPPRLGPGLGRRPDGRRALRG